jgi:nicotinamide-nucleotide amidase
MYQMFAQMVVPRLHASFRLQPGRRVTLRTIGVGESDLQQAMGSWSHPGVTIGYRTTLPENHIKLWVDAGLDDDAVMAVVTQVWERIGRWVFTTEGCPRPPAPGVDIGGGNHAAAVGRRIAAAGATLAVAESCTGGRIAAACTATPGASAWFVEGLVTYANAAKTRLLGVSEADLAQHGAVSEVVARAMAEGVRSRAGTTWGIGVTGVAGPDGGSPDKPVGTVHVAISGPTVAGSDRTHHRAVRLPGDRDRVQTLAVATALELLRRQLVDT